MALSQHDQKYVKEFLAYAEPLTKAYRHGTLRSEEGIAIAQARLLLNVMPSITPFSHFKSENVRAGQCRLEELQLDLPGIINALVAGGISTPHGEFVFPPAEGGRYSTLFLPFRTEAAPSHTRTSMLRLAGGHIGHVPQPQTDCLRKPSGSHE